MVNLGLENLDKKKMLLLGLLCLAIIYVDLSFLMKLQSAGIKDSTVKIIKIKKDFITLNKDLAAMKEAQVKQAQVKQQVAVKAKKVISEEQIPALLQEVSNIANRNNVKIMQIKPVKDAKFKEEPIPGLKKFSTLGITMDLTCGYHNLGKFLNELDASQQVMLIESARITSGSDDYLQQNINLILKTYVKK